MQSRVYETKCSHQEAELILRGLRLLWEVERERLLIKGEDGIGFSNVAELLSDLEKRWFVG